MKFVEVVKSDITFCLSLKPLSSVPKCDLKKSSLTMTSSLRHKSPYDTYFEEVINCAQFWNVYVKKYRSS